MHFQTKIFLCSMHLQNQQWDWFCWCCLAQFKRPNADVNFIAVRLSSFTSRNHAHSGALHCVQFLYFFPSFFFFFFLLIHFILMHFKFMFYSYVSLSLSRFDLFFIGCFFCVFFVNRTSLKNSTKTEYNAKQAKRNKFEIFSFVWWCLLYSWVCDGLIDSCKSVLEHFKQTNVQISVCARFVRWVCMCAISLSKEKRNKIYKYTK